MPPKYKRKEWLQLIDSNTNLERGLCITNFLKWNFQTNNMKPKIIWKNATKTIHRIISHENLSDKDIEVIKFVAPFSTNFDFDFNDPFGMSPMDRVVCNGHTEIIEILAPLTQYQNFQTSYMGHTPISYAVKNENLRMIQVLARLVKNLNSPDIGGYTPIHWAAFNGNLQIMAILIATTENPITQDINGETAIHWAVKKGHKNVVEMLISSTKNPNAPNINGITPFEFAKRKGYVEIMKILKEKLMNIHLEKKKRKTIEDDWMLLHDMKKLKKEEKNILELV